MIVGITGHRPERIRNREKEIEIWLNGQIKNLKGCYGDIILLDGMAQGVDQIAALVAIKNGVDVKCYFPYKHKLSETEKYIADNAAEIRYEGEKYQKGCYFKRDRRIVDDCDLLIVVWDGIENGGAYYTWKYAVEKKKNILMFPWEDTGVKENWDAIDEGYNELPHDD